MEVDFVSETLVDLNHLACLAAWENLIMCHIFVIIFIYQTGAPRLNLHATKELYSTSAVG